MERLLFIGGPADGERREVSRGTAHWLVSTHALAPFEPRHEATITVSYATYRREWLTDGHRRYAVMLIDDGTVLIDALLAGYRRQPAQQVQV